MPGRFVKVFTAPTAFEAHFIRSVLEHRGVTAHVRNDTFSLYTVQPEVWADVNRLDAVEEVLAELRAAREIDGALSIAEVEDEVGRLSLREKADAVSRCASCGEENPAHFELCWRCGEAVA